MGPYSRFKTNSCRSKSKVPHISFLSRSLRRQISAVIVLLSVTCALIHGFAQTKEPDKRGVGVPSGPVQTSANTRPILSDRPELILQTGHTQSVNAVAFSPDDRWLASGGKDNVIKVWDLTTGNVLRTLYGHSSNINALAVSEDGQLLASGSGNIKDDRDFGLFIKGGVVGGEDNTVRIWNVQTGRELHVLRGHELPVGAVAFSNDGRFLTSVSGDSVKMWDVAAGTELGSQKTKYEKSGGEKLGSLSIFGSSKQEKQQQQRFKNFRQSASKIAVSANGRAAAIGQPDKAIKIYDAQSGRELRELSFKANPQTENSSLAFSADANLVAFAKTSESVCVQEAVTGRERYCVNAGFSKTPQRVQFSSDGRWLVTATANSTTLKLWDATTGQLIRELNTPGEPATNFRVISFSRDGNHIAAVAPGSKAIRIFATTTGSEILTLKTRGIDPDSSSRQAAFIKSIDSKTMSILQKRDITSPEQMIEAVEAMATLSSDKFQAGRAVSFSPDGRFLISRQMVLKNLLTEVWDSQTGGLVPVSDDVAMRDRAKPFYSPDGRYRVAPYFANQHLNDFSPASIFVPVANAFKDAYKQRVDLHDGQSDKTLYEFDGGKAPDMGIVPAAGFSFDSKLIAITGFEKEERSVLIYETEKGRKVNTFPINDDENSGPVTTLCISGDARFLAAGYATKIDIFEVASGKTIRTLPHAGRVVSLSFSPDGRFLVALGGNNDKELWETSTGEKLATLVNLGGAINKGAKDWLVVTPDGLFDGSPNAFRQILWQFGGNTFDVTPAETFFNEFYYPGLLAEVMAGKKPHAPKNISQLDRRQPELKLMTKDAQTGRESISERHLMVKIEVAEKQADKDHNAGSGARDVRLFRNGALVKVWRGDVLRGQPSTTLEANLSIVAGENRLSAYAFNRDNIKSMDATLNLSGASSLTRKGIAYVLTIGINVYSNDEYNLKYGVADAEAFGEEVQRQQQQIANYSHIEVVSLMDDRAKKTTILSALRRLAGVEEGAVADEPALRNMKATEPEDAVFIYFAGHGTAQGQRFYLIPHDLGYTGERTELDAAGLRTILEHSISDQELLRAVEGIDADKLLMVIDACNSGQALEAEERRRGPMNSKGLAQLAYEKGMYILTAAQSYQAAQEVSQLGHGLLTYALVEEGLKQGAADSDPKDGQIVVREWFDYATTRVPNMQLEKLKAARDLGMGLSFVEPDAKPISAAPSAERRVTQTPRAFYRRESEDRPLIVARR
ncbi:MAG TPA: caspase family protein [Pyrinomonadaceae bacterium]|nr:caspase family protein [Pyrinomonadaceae bacterium]